jgi:Thioredoxin like C-terminal domain
MTRAAPKSPGGGDAAGSQGAEPYIRAWSRAYRQDGLVVIGVHTPEFSFEHDGVIRDRHFGEGHYAESERLLQQLLGVQRDLVSAVGAGVEAEADWMHLRTPETYLGYARGESFASPGGAAVDVRRSYELPESLRTDQWALTGDWTVGREYVAPDRSGGSIAFRFHARDAHLVLSSASRDPIAFRVLLDGEPPGSSRGADVDENGNGALVDGRLYQLIRQDGEVRDRTMEITFSEPGAEAYVFTFG